MARATRIRRHGLLAIAFVSGAALQPWLELRQTHYSIFFERGFERDATLVAGWADATERLMQDKYGVTPARYRMSIYLHAAPTKDANVDTALNRCCKNGPDAVEIGTIDMLAPSAPAMQSATAVSSLGLPKTLADYSAKVLVSEYIPIGHYAAQATRTHGGWRYYDAPNWFVQGLQEYDAIFHSTAFNRDSTALSLTRWATAHRAVFSCCTPDLIIRDDYNGGASFMAFLAVRFGEDIHARLLKSGAPTFFDALTAETTPLTRPQLFDAFQHWLDRGAPLK